MSSSVSSSVVSSPSSTVSVVGVVTWVVGTLIVVYLLVVLLRWCGGEWAVEDSWCFGWVCWLEGFSLAFVLVGCCGLSSGV